MENNICLKIERNVSNKYTDLEERQRFNGQERSETKLDNKYRYSQNFKSEYYNIVNFNTEKRTKKKISIPGGTPDTEK